MFKNYSVLQNPTCTTEADALLEFMDSKSATSVAKQNNLSPRTVRHWVSKAKKILQNEEFGVPENHALRKTSTGTYVRDEDGVLQAIEWVSTDVEQEKIQENLEFAIQSLTDTITKEKPVKAPKLVKSDLCSCYVLTDYHLGQLSWAEEAGENWDTDIAYELLQKWFGAAIAQAPASEVGILAQLGDFLHWDGLVAQTNASGHSLDADTRFGNLTDLAIKAIRLIVKQMLTKHKHVHVILAEGNHDDSSSSWLRSIFTVLFEDEPRVTVDNSKAPYYAYRFGDTSLFFHHGHKKRLAGLPEVFVSMYREMYGDTTYSYGHTGHLHHRELKENGMMIMEQHPTLAPKDAYSARGGYFSKRAAHVITYSKKHGEVSRVTVSPDMVS